MVKTCENDLQWQNAWFISEFTTVLLRIQLVQHTYIYIIILGVLLLSLNYMNSSIEQKLSARMKQAT